MSSGDQLTKEGIGWSGAELRLRIREGRFRGPTSGLAKGFVQANLVALPEAWAYDFLVFCQRNPRSCSLLDITDVGSTSTAMGADIDLRRDVPKYCIYENGVLKAETQDATPYWRGDLVCFLLGCSFSFEWALLEAGIPLKHIAAGKNVAMYRTSVQCRPAGRFCGPMVVSMRPIPFWQVPDAFAVAARYRWAHGAPVHVGDPSVLGIRDLSKPDWGDAVEIDEGTTPVFWGCGVTPQAVALVSKVPFMITHAPGHMLVTDRHCMSQTLDPRT